MTAVNDALRLDYAGSPFDSGGPYAEIDFPATAQSLGQTRVPKSAGFYGGANDRYLQDDGSLSANVMFPFREKPHVYPYTGNGFAASKDGVLRPELHIGERVPLPPGTTLTKRNTAGVVTEIWRLEEVQIGTDTVLDWRPVTP